MGDCAQCGSAVRGDGKWCSRLCRLLDLAERNAFGRRIPLCSIREPQFFPAFAYSLRCGLYELYAWRHRIAPAERAE